MRVDHIAIAVRSLDEALAAFHDRWHLDAALVEQHDSDDVREAMLPIGDTHIQLIEATSDTSPVARFIARRGEGLHHIAIEVDDLEGELANLSSAGMQLIDEVPRPGGDDLMCAFVHPSTNFGVLIELVHRARPVT